MVRLALAAALAIGLAGCSTSGGYFKEETAAATEGGEFNAFATVMTMAGVIPSRKERIEYTPRAPLAIPGSTELPDPNSATAAQQTANFPVDHDARERDRLQAVRGSGERPRPASEALRDNVAGGARLSSDEVQAMRREGGGLTRRGDELVSLTDKETERLTRAEMRQTFRSGPGNRQILAEDGTPTPRRTLTQPPDIYRTPASTAALPEAGDIENSDWVRKRVYGVQDRRPARLITE